MPVGVDSAVQSHRHSLVATRRMEQAGASPRIGLSDLLTKIQCLPLETRTEIEADIQACYAERCGLAMVNSDEGITNLHMPNDVIVDASMPAMLRDGGKMWNSKGELQETIAMIPDRCYATMYMEVVRDCNAHGQFDPATMGAVSNVGLMAQSAEEYGSHNKTFESPGAGAICVVNAAGATLMEQQVAAGDIFRACQTKDAAVRDWVRLACARARASGAPTVFWLDANRAHDAQLLKKVQAYLAEQDTDGLELHTLDPVLAQRFTLARVRAGQETISATGNVLRDYLTDLYPILELGTSARMLSIVPLLNGGGVYETGAGGSAPQQVKQFLKENHLRWDSLGEYCALVPSLEQVARQAGNTKAGVLAATLDKAIFTYLDKRKLPSRKAGEIDNRGSTFYLAQYWAVALAQQDTDAALKARFTPLAAVLEASCAKIEAELLACQNVPVDLDGYFLPDKSKIVAAMRPSITLNAIIDSF